MADCCAVRAVPRAQRRGLYVVLALNVLLFLVEAVAGLLAHSTALVADSLDMLGDAAVYGFSLYVIGRGARWEARAALTKGLLMAAFAGGVLVQAVRTLRHGLLPTADVMGAVGGLALAANLTCLLVLWRRRGDDLNMRSAWLCSRNDVLGNLGVLAAAAAVRVTGSPWPDLAVGLSLTALFGHSAVQVIRDALRAGVALRVGSRAAGHAAR